MLRLVNRIPRTPFSRKTSISLHPNHLPPPSNPRTLRSSFSSVTPPPQSPPQKQPQPQEPFKCFYKDCSMPKIWETSIDRQIDDRIKASVQVLEDGRLKDMNELLNKKADASQIGTLKNRLKYRLKSVEDGLKSVKGGSKGLDLKILNGRLQTVEADLKGLMESPKQVKDAGKKDAADVAEVKKKTGLDLVQLRKDFVDNLKFVGSVPGLKYLAKWKFLFDGFDKVLDYWGYLLSFFLAAIGLSGYFDDLWNDFVAWFISKCEELEIAIRQWDSNVAPILCRIIDMIKAFKKWIDVIKMKKEEKEKQKKEKQKKEKQQKEKQLKETNAADAPAAPATPAPASPAAPAAPAPVTPARTTPARAAPAAPTPPPPPTTPPPASATQA